MTNAEIYREWKQAKDPKNQIGIIADMEFRSKKKPVAAAIMEQCEFNGETVPPYIKRIAGMDISEDLKALVDSGLTVKEIADELGASVSAVISWMQKAGLKKKAAKVSGADDPGQCRTSADSEKVLASAPPVMMEMVKFIAECAERLGRGEVIASSYPDGSYFVIWKPEADHDGA